MSSRSLRLVLGLPGAALLIGGCSASPAPSGVCPTDSGMGCAPQNSRVDLYTPTFSNPTQVDNPHYPISQLHSVVFTGVVDGKPFRTETTLLPETRMIEWNGQEVETVVQQYMAFSDGRIEEIAIDWFAQAPLFSVILIVSWQWLPFAALILLTALQSLDEEQREAALMDGAGEFSIFFYITLPHLARPIAVVILIETIFLLTVFAEIFVTTGGGPGLATTNIAFLIYSEALIRYNVGGASAGGLIAVVIANILAFFLVRIVGRNLEA